MSSWRTTRCVPPPRPLSSLHLCNRANNPPQKVYDIIHPKRQNLTAIRNYVRIGGLADDPRADPQDRAWFGPHDHRGGEREDGVQARAGVGCVLFRSRPTERAVDRLELCSVVLGMGRRWRPGRAGRGPHLGADGRDRRPARGRWITRRARAQAT